MKRDTSLDFIRIIALISVISIHFFRHIGYYNLTLQGRWVYVLTLARSFFRVCVPLFLILTGYLMNKKVLKGVTIKV